MMEYARIAQETQAICNDLSPEIARIAAMDAAWWRAKAALALHDYETFDAEMVAFDAAKGGAL